jgi:hypothetical protein
MLPGEKGNGTLEDLGAVMGTEAALRLIAVFGGASLYVPTVVGSTHPILHVVGQRPFQRLVDAFGGETLCLPGGSEFFRLRRMRQVARLLADGTSVEDLARRFRYTPRTIRNIRHQIARMGLDGRRLPQD